MSSNESPAAALEPTHVFAPNQGYDYANNQEQAGGVLLDEGIDDEQDDYEDYDLINNTRANAATSQQHQPQYEGYPGSEEEDDYSESEVPQRLPPQMIADHSPSPEESNRPRKKKWFGVI